MKYLHRYLNLVFSTDLLAPLALVVFYVIFLIIIKGVVPSSEEIIANAQSLYSRYGYELIFFGALFESLVLVNLLAPGSLAIGLGAVFARVGVLDLTTAVLSAILGAVLAVIIDYYLGYFGFSKVLTRFGLGKILLNAKQRLEKDPIKSFSLGFIHPNVGAIVSLAAGASKIKFKYFLGLATVSTAAWLSFWGILIYILGEVFLKILTKYFPLLAILFICIWVLSILYSKRRKV